jgi:hypothetical protein
MRQRVTVKKYNKEIVTTKEELEEIRKQNKEKLDWILDQGIDYIILKAKEVYGDNWMSIFAGEKHYLHKERLDNNRLHLRSGGKNPKKGNRLRRIHQIDFKTNEIIHIYQNAEDARIGMDLSDKQISSLLAVCTGRYEHYKGFKWKFEDDNQIELNQNEQENQ